MTERKPIQSDKQYRAPIFAYSRDLKKGLDNNTGYTGAVNIKSHFRDSAVVDFDRLNGCSIALSLIRYRPVVSCFIVKVFSSTVYLILLKTDYFQPFYPRDA